MITPFVSVLIDTYNYGRFIEQAIDSVLSQDFLATQMEILVIDDGSIDDTAQRVKRYCSRIQYFRKVNGGQASAFNAGFARCRGDLIFLLDADDYWLPNKLRRMVDVFLRDPVGMVSNAYELSSPGTHGCIPSHPDLVSGNVPADLKSLLRYRIFPTSCLAFRRSALERLMPVPESIKLQADAYLALLIIFVTSVLAIPEQLTVYRIHGENLYSVAGVRNTPDSQRRRHQTSKIILEEIHRWLMRNGYNTNERNIRAFLDQWTIFQQAAEYAIDPPTRLQLFLHLLRYNRTYRGQQNWKLTILNYLSAVAALVRRYKRPNRQIAPPEGVQRG
jgi:glycosyltransferase involved in cell wall biosynthesis